MARYNTVTSAAASSGGTTLASPAQGLLTTLTGSAPYTVNLASPVLYTGTVQSFFNNTTGTITFATPSGCKCDSTSGIVKETLYSTSV